MVSFLALKTKKQLRRCLALAIAKSMKNVYPEAKSWLVSPRGWEWIPPDPKPDGSAGAASDWTRTEYWFQGFWLNLFLYSQGFVLESSKMTISQFWGGSFRILREVVTWIDSTRMHKKLPLVFYCRKSGMSIHFERRYPKLSFWKGLLFNKEITKKSPGKQAPTTRKPRRPASHRWCQTGSKYWWNQSLAAWFRDPEMPQTNANFPQPFPTPQCFWKGGIEVVDDEMLDSPIYCEWGRGPKKAINCLVASFGTKKGGWEK